MSADHAVGHRLDRGAEQSSMLRDDMMKFIMPKASITRNGMLLSVETTSSRIWLASCRRCAPSVKLRAARGSASAAPRPVRRRPPRRASRGGASGGRSSPDRRRRPRRRRPRGRPSSRACGSGAGRRRPGAAARCSSRPPSSSASRGRARRSRRGRGSAASCWFSSSPSIDCATAQKTKKPDHADVGRRACCASAPPGRRTPRRRAPGSAARTPRS